MRTSTLFIFLFAFGILSGQNLYNAEDLFSVNKAPVVRTDHFTTDEVFLTIDTRMMSDILRTNEQQLTMSIPISDTETAEMTLERFEVFSKDFYLTTSAGDTIKNYIRPVNYRGKLKNQDGFATITVTNEEVMGIISIKDKGNFNLGRLEGRKVDYIIYNDATVKENIGIECHSNSLPELDRRHDEDNVDNRSVTSGNCIKVYLEGDYALYQNKGSIQNTMDYMSGLFAQMATLYNNEQISIEIHSSMVWTTQDTYDKDSSSAALYGFGATLGSMTADLGHLFALGGNNIGGVAWLDALCFWDNYNKCAYSNIYSSYSTVPTYSWSVGCITHEMGHNLGSKHTQACVWNGNNTAIDGCVATEGGCPNPGLPTNGGTIMSYCHIVSGVGINFNNGFGPQPGNLILGKYNSASCLTACDGGDGGNGGNNDGCDEPTNLTLVDVDDVSVVITWSPPSLAPSGYEIALTTDGSQPAGQGLPFNYTGVYYSGLTSNTTYYFWVRSDCGDNEYSDWAGPVTFTTLPLSSLANNHCAGAIEIPVTQGFATDPLLTTIDGATKSLNITSDGNCLNNASPEDVWFKINPLGNQVIIETFIRGGLTSWDNDFIMEVYSGSCNNLIYVTCNDDAYSDDPYRYMPGLALTGVNGQTLYIRILKANWGGNDQSNFAIAAYDPNNLLPLASSDCVPGTVDIQIANGNAYRWVPLLDSSGHLIGELHPDGQELGTISSSVHINTGPIRKDGNNVYYLDRDYNIQAQNPPIYGVSAYLYYSPTEFQALQAEDGSISGVDKLNASKFSDIDCGDSPGNMGINLPNYDDIVYGNYYATAYGINSFSTFFIHGGNSVLPVHLLSFNAQKSDDGTVLLDWKTEKEENLREYIITRSHDGREFTNISKISAQNLVHYQSVDKNPLSGENYYRLEMIDYDGSSKYSDIRRVSINNAIDVLSLHPNPAMNKIFISGLSEELNNAKIEVYDDLGRQVVNGYFVPSSLSSSGLDIESLLPGNYVLKIKTEAEISVLRFIKQ